MEEQTVASMKVELESFPTMEVENPVQSHECATGKPKQPQIGPSDARASQVNTNGDQNNGGLPLLTAATTQSKPRRVFDKEGCARTWRHVELEILLCLIVVVWGLLLLPVIFYHLSEEEV